MAETLLERSARFIDTGEAVQREINPTDGTFHEVADGVGIVCGFSHSWALRAAEGLVLFDTSHEMFGPAIVNGFRSWTDDPVDTIVYTHGHADHVGGAGALLADAAHRGHARPTIIGHEAVAPRFDRYLLTEGYQTAINRRQFGGIGKASWSFIAPDETFRDDLLLTRSGLSVELRHDRGETDDHAWAWVPEHKAILVGDLFIWMFPNAGNPQKVQRFAAEWAVALRKMAALGAELMLPAHGLPIAGAARIKDVLETTASALEGLVHDTLEMMNARCFLDEIVHTVKVPDELLAKPYLRPAYDEPEFVVRNIWRLYGGWWDGNAARLKPAPEASVAAEVAALAGGADALAARAVAVADGGDLRLAAQLAEWAAQADPTNAGVHAARADVYGRRQREELSLMASAIFRDAATTSSAVVDAAELRS